MYVVRKGALCIVHIRKAQLHVSATLRSLVILKAPADITLRVCRQLCILPNRTRYRQGFSLRGSHPFLFLLYYMYEDVNDAASVHR